MKYIYIYVYERGGGKVKMFWVLRDKGEDLPSCSSVQDGMFTRFYAVLQLVIEPATLQANGVSPSFQL